MSDFRGRSASIFEGGASLGAHLARDVVYRPTVRRIQAAAALELAKGVAGRRRLGRGRLFRRACKNPSTRGRQISKLSEATLALIGRIAAGFFSLRVIRVATSVADAVAAAAAAGQE